MSILSFVEPIESAVPVAEDALAMAALAVRTIGGLGAMAAMFILFRPLLTGIWHALLISIKPRTANVQRPVPHPSSSSHSAAGTLDARTVENSIT